MRAIGVRLAQVIRMKMSQIEQAREELILFLLTELIRVLDPDSWSEAVEETQRMLNGDAPTSEGRAPVRLRLIKGGRHGEL